MDTIEKRLENLGITLPNASNPAASYTNYVLVKNGFSELMVEVFEDKGIHARSVFGASSLRDHLPIIVDSIFEIE